MNTNIQHLIYELENRYPEDNLITCYKDFLQIRDYLSCYQFNPVVFQSLIKLTINLWKTEQRIDRLSLLFKIKQYGLGKEGYKTAIDIQTRKLIFTLFKNTVEKAQLLTERQTKEAEMICNSLLVNLPLTEEEETWLCENENQSSIILNRILRYPVRSKIISQWINKYFNTDKFCTRRAEAIGWLLDENPDFVVDKQILFADFEYINQIDAEIILSNREDYLSSWSSSKEKKDYLGVGSLTYRPYIVLSYQHNQGTQPDFSELRRYFYENIDIIIKQTMLWAIAYSRLDVCQKIELLQKYYCDELFASLLKICKKYKLIEVLKWLQTKAINDVGLPQHGLLRLEIGNVILPKKKQVEEMEFFPITTRLFKVMCMLPIHFKELLCLYYPFTIQDIKDYEKCLSWCSLSCNVHLDWSEELLKAFEDKWNRYKSNGVNGIGLTLLKAKGMSDEDFIQKAFEMGYISKLEHSMYVLINAGNEREKKSPACLNPPKELEEILLQIEQSSLKDVPLDEKSQRTLNIPKNKELLETISRIEQIDLCEDDFEDENFRKTFAQLTCLFDCENLLNNGFEYTFNTSEKKMILDDAVEMFLIEFRENMRENNSINKQN